MDTDILKSIDKTLKAILSILAAQRPDNTLKLKEQVLRLRDIGLGPKEISEVIGRSSIYVNKELSETKKSKKGGRRPNAKTSR